MIGPPLDSARGPRALPGRPGSARRGERGGISWVTLLLLVLVAGAGYWAWVWVPVYFDDYTVKQVVRDYQNQAIKNNDDEALRRNMVLKIRSLSERDTVDEWGRPVRVPAIPLEERDVTWERDTASQPPMLRVAFEYVREVEYPGLKRTVTKVFVIDLSNDLTIANWGPPR
ncbi:MAG TPA: hypothetical protein VF841_17445 [Anaeromyxobacter sp.]